MDIQRPNYLFSRRQCLKTRIKFKHVLFYIAILCLNHNNRIGRNKFSDILGTFEIMGTYKVRNKIETKRNETKSTKTKRNQQKRNETKRNQRNENEIKRNQREQNEINENKTK